MSATPKRVVSLDVFRGLTMGAMLVVNNPGSWSYIYPPLKHAAWFGCTPTDLIFPFFLFAVGLSMAYSSRLNPGKADAQPASGAPLIKTYLSVLKRSAILVALGLGLNLTSVLMREPIDLSTWRLPGVLQRIGLCYLLCVVMVLNLPRVWQWLVGGGILVGYWLLLSQVGVPGFDDPSTRLTAAGSMVAHIDRLILGESHMYKVDGVAHDPEGLLSTLPALVSTLWGFWVGSWLKNRGPNVATAGWLAFGGAVACLAGWLWHVGGFPMSKDLWTSSYVVYTSGWAMLTLAACWGVCQVIASRTDSWRHVAKVAWPLEVLGMNAILAFVGSGLLARLLTYIKIDVPAGMATGGAGNAQSPQRVTCIRWTFEQFVAAGLSPINASLAYALLTLVVWWLVLLVCYRMRWFWRI